MIILESIFYNNCYDYFEHWIEGFISNYMYDGINQGEGFYSLRMDNQTIQDVLNDELE